MMGRSSSPLSPWDASASLPSAQPLGFGELNYPRALCNSVKGDLPTTMSHVPAGKGKRGMVGSVVASLAAQAAHAPGLPENEEAMSTKAGLGSQHQPCSSQS